MILGTFWVHLGAFESARKPFIAKASVASPRTPPGGLQRPPDPQLQFAPPQCTTIRGESEISGKKFLTPKPFLLYTALYLYIYSWYYLIINKHILISFISNIITSLIKILSIANIQNMSFLSI